MARLELEVRGKKYTGRTYKEIAQKAKLTQATVKELIKNNSIRYITNNSGLVLKFDLKKSIPLVVREFLDIPKSKKLTTNTLVKADRKINERLITKDVKAGVFTCKIMLYNPYWGDYTKNGGLREATTTGSFASVDDMLNSIAERIYSYSSRTSIYNDIKKEKFTEEEKRERIMSGKTVDENSPFYEMIKDEVIQYYQIVDEHTKNGKSNPSKVKPNEYDFDIESYLYISQIFIYSAEDTQNFTIDINKMILKKPIPLDLRNIYSNIKLNASKDENCVKKILKETFNHLTDKINALPDKGITFQELTNFIKTHELKASIFDISGSIRFKNIVNKKAKRVCFVCYNNHIYGVEGDILHSVDYTDSKYEDKVVSFSECNKKYVALIDEKHIIPSIQDTKFGLGDDGKYGVLTFTNKNKRYIVNDEFLEAKEVLTIFGLEKQMQPNTTLSQVMPLIENLFDKTDISTYMPDAQAFKIPAFNYNSGEDATGAYTIDMNGSYYSILAKLPFLISVDYRTASHVTILKEESDKLQKDIPKIVDHFQYICEPIVSTLLLPETQILTGYELKICIKNGVPLNIKECLTTTRHNNKYSRIIPAVIEKCKKRFGDKKGKEIYKKLFTRMIGCFETLESVKELETPKAIYVDDEVKDSKNKGETVYSFGAEGNKKYVVHEIKKAVSHLYNRLPISLQIKNGARFAVFNKIVECEATEIIQIKTDSITYRGNAPKVSTELGGFKLEKYKALKADYTSANDYGKNLSFITKNYNGVLVNCLAGAGKTYHIINTTLKNITKETIKEEDDAEFVETDKSYIVLTPSNKSVETYRKKELNCAVSQKYTLSNTIPTENHVIIDEFGMLDKKGHDMLRKCQLLGKRYYCYGDFNQLLNPDEPAPLNGDLYLNSMFHNKIELDDNYRNDFTKEYYHSLIDGTVDVQKEVHKHAVKNYLDAEYVICYRHDTVDEYNEMIMSEKDIKLTDIGTKIICVGNIKSLQNKEIFRGMTFTIQSRDGDEFTLDNGQTISKKQLKHTKFFKPAYALTIYALQGSECKSYFYAPEDNHLLTPRVAYVVISRLKTKNI